MSSRTRSHILEDISKDRFKQLLPESWVFREKSKDYGLDCEVEVFDDDGNTTGHIFWVQLKATDSKDHNTILKVRFDKEKLLQLCSYSLPVLIARYSSHKNKFYLTWANKIPLVKARDDSKSLSVEFDESDEWGIDSPIRIKEYLHKLNELKRGKLDFPIKCYIENRELKSKTIISLKTKLSSYSEFIELVRLKDDADLFIEATNKIFIITLLGEFGSSFGFGGKSHDEIETDELSSIIMLGLAITLGVAGKLLLLNNLLEEKRLRDMVIERPGILINLIPFLITNGNNLKKNLSLILDSINLTDNQNIVLVANFQILKIEKAINDDTFNVILNYHDSLLKRAIKSKKSAQIASCYYNLGKYHMSCGDLKDSVHYFNNARKHNPDYLKLDYFLKDLGGVLFELERYKLSAFFYKESLLLNDKDKITYCLFGDALLYSGEYEEAKFQYSEFVMHEKISLRHQCEWYLKYTCLVTLINIGYPKSQKRNIVKAIELADPKNYKGENDAIEKLSKSLECDFLCPLAWFNMALERNKVGDVMNSMFGFILTGLLNRKDLEAWVNATIICYQTEAPYFLQHIINTGYYYCGEEYIEELFKICESNTPEKSEDLINKVEELMLEKGKERKEMRFVGEKGEVFKIQI